MNKSTNVLFFMKSGGEILDFRLTKVQINGSIKV
jgi:hypothetical protein